MSGSRSSKAESSNKSFESGTTTTTTTMTLLPIHLSPQGRVMGAIPAGSAIAE